MSSRLSEDTVRGVYDSGYGNLPWLWEPKALPPVALDLNQISTLEDARTIVQSLPSQQLYHAIKAKGLDDSWEVLELLSTDQLARMIDYDSWHNDELQPRKAFAWLSKFKVLGPSGIYSRYSRLDEEYQIGLLQGHIKLYTEEEKDTLPVEIQDQLAAMPCNKVFYQIICETEGEQQFINDLIQSCLDSNISYAYSLLEHAFYMPPNEPHHLMTQFRKAHLEEDGFVSFEQAQHCFVPIDIEALKDKWLSRCPQRSGLVIHCNEKQSFLDEVIKLADDEHLTAEDSINIHQHFLHLANGLCSAVQIEPDDFRGLIKILEYVKAYVGWGLEILSDGYKEVALQILKEEHPHVLFRCALTQIKPLQDQAMAIILKRNPPKTDKIERAYKLRKYGQLLYLIDTQLLNVFGFEVTESLKGLFNRFPMRPVVIKDRNDEVMKVKFLPVDSIAAYQCLRDLVTNLQNEVLN